MGMDHRQEHHVNGKVGQKPVGVGGFFRPGASYVPLGVARGVGRISRSCCRSGTGWWAHTHRSTFLCYLSTAIC
ncbi:hypothetical protein TWF281_005722 [Arthrobotrys megalospora]